VQFPDVPPPVLTTFTASDWPAADEREAFGHWCAARRVFFENHGWPGGILPRMHEEMAEGARLAPGWSHLGPQDPG
jgi:hypothetical protein